MNEEEVLTSGEEIRYLRVERNCLGVESTHHRRRCTYERRSTFEGRGSTYEWRGSPRSDPLCDRRLEDELREEMLFRDRDHTSPSSLSSSSSS